MSGLFVTGTDTGVGKTVVAGAVGLALRARGLRIGACKPVQSGALAADPAGDAALLRAWLDIEDPLDEICPHAFTAPLAPLVAAQLEGRRVEQDSVVEHVRRLEARADVLVVEGAGGLLVPVGKDWTIGDLAARLDYPVVVVARPGLGTINHTLLTVTAVRNLGLRVAGVIMNGDDPEASRNAELIEDFGEVRVLGRTPWLEDGPTPERLLALAEEHVDVDALASLLREEAALGV